MPSLPSHPTLKDIQVYVSKLEEERSFDHQDILQKCLILGEEMGELFKAVRKHQKIALDTKSTVSTVSDELADILIMMCTIANRFDIDLERAFRDKEEFNKQRIWKTG